MKKSFVLYHDQYEALEDLTGDQKGQLLDMMFLYNTGRELPECDPVVKMAFKFFKIAFDRDCEKWKSVVERNKNNGKKGGRPKGSKNNNIDNNPDEPKKPSGLFGNPENPDEPKKAVSVIGSVTGSVIGTGIIDKKHTQNQVLPSPCPHQKIINIWHEVLPVLPQIKVWGESSKNQLKARWREDKQRQDLKWWRELFIYISKSDFLTGKTDKPFQASLGWVVKASNFEKIINGNYENRGPNTGSSLTDHNIMVAKAFLNG